jgi:phosphatidylserine/phosphatidylglycerophosphate/cardiolipin synthase-like enzyme
MEVTQDGWLGRVIRPISGCDRKVSDAAGLRHAVVTVRDRVGSRRRRGYREWGRFPEASAGGTTWWAEEPQWFPAGTPPRLHTKITLHVDGQETFRAAWQAIRDAKHSVWLADWALSTDMELVRGRDRDAIPPVPPSGGSGYRVLDLLAEVAGRADVRVLLWRGSLLFQPRAGTARRNLKRLQRANPALHGLVDKHVRLAHCHHQKTIVVDGRIAFVGGLDMTDHDIDRWDTTEHPLRDGFNWHDVCFQLEGEAATDVARNFAQRWHAVCHEHLSISEAPPPEPDQGVAAQVVRTIPAGNYPFAPDGEYGIAWAYRQALGRAQCFIYLENQYLWAPAVMNELIAALHRVEDPNFRIVLVLPAKPNVGKRDTDLHVRQLLEADGGRGRVQVFTLYTARPEDRLLWAYKPLYVHAKVAIVDDTWCMVGSANLNERGLEGDSEINMQVLDEELSRRLRLRLWAEHLGVRESEIAALSPHAAIDTLWVPRADAAVSVMRERSGSLPSMAVRYDLGAMPGDLAVGALQAALLDG